jgi:hypothetical protein
MFTLRRNIALPIIAFFLVMSDTGFAGQGCCSYHGGQDYCGSSGKWMCKDGTESPTCSCSSSSTYESSGSSRTATKLSCQKSERLVGDRCLDFENACIAEHGFFASSNEDGTCFCRTGYQLIGGACTFVDESSNKKEERSQAALRRAQQTLNKVGRLAAPRGMKPPSESTKKAPPRGRASR